MTEGPAEHARFRDYLRALSQVSETDECDLLRTILDDPDQAMAQSAIIRHIDRVAARLGAADGYAQRHERIALAVRAHDVPRKRLEEWALFNAVIADHPWSTANLIEASNWLQRKVAEHASSPRALATLTEHGRTSRVRATARSRSNAIHGP